MENIFVEFLPPWVETGLQPAFYDKESGTVLQQTARMYDRVNMLIRMFNKLSKNTKETVEDYIDKFNTLYNYVHDYFDNLDVQEEINNKLDDMEEEGTLQEIITAYIQANVEWTFDTVADMKTATNLINGSFATTLGYYNVDDGGSSVYKIVESEPSSYYETLDSGLYAQLIIDGSINTKQFGIVGDGITDETSKLQKFFTYNTNNYVINSPNILINGDMTLTSNSYVKFEEGCKITRKATSDEHYYMLYLDNVENVTINNAWLVGDRATHTGAGGEWGHGINIVCSKNVEVLNSKIEYTWGDGIYIGLWNTTVGTYVQPENIRVSGCIIDHCSRNGISACSGDNIIIENTTISNTNRTNPKSGIDIELEAPSGQTPSFKNLIIRNVNTRENIRGIIINCSSTYDAGVVNITGHHSYKEAQGVLMNTFDYQNSTLIYENGYIELADTFAMDLSKLNNNTAYFKDVIIDSSVNNSLARDYHGAISVRNATNNTNGGFVFDNIKMIQSHTDAYVWRTLFIRNNSTTGTIEDIYINNYSWEPSLSVDLMYMASNGTYDWSKIKITNTTLSKTYNGDNITLSATNTLFANIWNRSIWQASTSTISDSIPDGEYEITLPNTGSNVHTLVFNSAYSVYNGTSTSVTQRTYTANKSGSYIKFKKIGSEIYIVGNIGYTAS